MKRALVILLVALAAPGVARAAVTVTASVQPSKVHFGDPFHYVVEAHGSGRVIADPGPFEVIGAPTTSRSGDTVRVTETLVCLGRGCVPNDGSRAVALPSPRAGDVSGAPVTVTVIPRVSAAAVKRGAYVEQKDVAPATARLGLAAAIAIALAVALVGAAAALLWRRRQAQIAAAGWTGTRLELALRFLRESAGRPVEDRRRAADFASRASEGSVADEATRLAWGPPAPGPADVETLADEVERAAR
ncbi:MAG TPA: hypothetical protein VGQ38_19740 [Gaiellaceae bacterium]|nr:hypothetical protein [Gaiellaceae bacterium]